MYMYICTYVKVCETKGRFASSLFAAEGRASRIESVLSSVAGTGRLR